MFSNPLQLTTQSACRNLIPHGDGVPLTAFKANDSCHVCVIARAAGSILAARDGYAMLKVRQNLSFARHAISLYRVESRRRARARGRRGLVVLRGELS